MVVLLVAVTKTSLGSGGLFVSLHFLVSSGGWGRAL
jgi:hypothetical protein